ncbi:MAG: hypothetical protein OEY52_10835 [Gammaproteobacteria bacterium]|nr:hypothetical protein [Gammaproteobacteria bacterium]
MNRLVVPIVSVLLLNVYAEKVWAENWSVRFGSDGQHERSVCLLESSVQRINDGQTMTPVKLVFNGDLMMAQTKSNIDLSYQGVGIQVDGRSIHKVDSLYKKTNAIFDKKAEEMVQEFIKGKQIKLVLGFWPSWPKTQTVSSRFSLQGFTRAYRKFQYCVKHGRIKK